MKKLLAITVALITMLICQSAIAVDATSAWNTYCGAYNFTPYPQGSTTTCAQAYYGSNFTSDAAAITNAVNSSLLTVRSPVANDDLLNASLQNWN